MEYRAPPVLGISYLEGNKARTWMSKLDVPQPVSDGDRDPGHPSPTIELTIDFMVAFICRWSTTPYPPGSSIAPIKTDNDRQAFLLLYALCDPLALGPELGESYVLLCLQGL
jgi:hypothetical protein